MEARWLYHIARVMLLRRKSFVKIGMYAYVILLFCGVSHAFFQFHGEVVVEGEITTFDARPTPEPEPEEPPIEPTEPMAEPDKESPEKPKEESEEEPKEESPEESAEEATADQDEPQESETNEA